MPTVPSFISLEIIFSCKWRLKFNWWKWKHFNPIQRITSKMHIYHVQRQSNFLTTHTYFFWENQYIKCSSKFWICDLSYFDFTNLSKLLILINEKSSVEISLRFLFFTVNKMGLRCYVIIGYFNWSHDTMTNLVV